MLITTFTQILADIDTQLTRIANLPIGTGPGSDIPDSVGAQAQALLDKATQIGTGVVVPGNPGTGLTVGGFALSNPTTIVGQFNQNVDSKSGTTGITVSGTSNAVVSWTASGTTLTLNMSSGLSSADTHAVTTSNTGITASGVKLTDVTNAPVAP